MPYRIAGIDVHKKMLAVVVADVEVDDEYRFERLKVGTSPAELRVLADWPVEREVDEVVMESTAQYWRSRLGGVGTVLETAAPDPQRRESPVRDTPPCTSAIESRRGRSEKGLSGRGTAREASDRPGTHFELRARRRAAALADRDATHASDHA
jgi:hypothetical protein